MKEDQGVGTESEADEDEDKDEVDEEAERRAQLVDKYGEDVVAAAVDTFGSVEYADDAFRNGQFEGVWAGPTDWARQTLDDTGELHALSDYLRRYFDYKSWVRDCEFGGDITVCPIYPLSGGSKVAIFRTS